MDITTLWFTQKTLKRFSQIQDLISIYQSSGFKTRIEITECEDGSYQIQNGHHRILALYMFGNKFLKPEDYILYQGEIKQRFGKVFDFFRYYFKNGFEDI